MDGSYRDLLDQITPVYGPHELLQRYFAIADRMARQRGVRLRLRGDFAALIELNRRHRDSWPPFLPALDPAHCRLAADSSFWLEGIDERGETVTTHAARLLDFADTDAVRETQALRVFYDDPAPHVAAGEFAEVNAPAAAVVRGRTMYGGAIWVRPDWRRQGLTKIVPRISRAYALTRWNTAFTWGFVEAKLDAVGVSSAYGPYSRRDRVVTRLAHRPGELSWVLVWMDRATLLADVARVVDQAMTDSSRRIEMPVTNRSPSAPRHGSSSRS
jgi:hypothetical protein